MESAASMVQAVIMDVHLPAGVAGPAPLDFDVRCFLVPHADGVVLIDAGMPGSVKVIDAALASLGARWSDISDIVLTHGHFDHVGGLPMVLEHAGTAIVWADVEDRGQIPLERRIQALAEGTTVRGLRALATPGHTPGHRSLLHEEWSMLFPGDVFGSSRSLITMAPEAFTQDAGQAEVSLRRLAELDVDRALVSHGPDILNPMQQCRR